MNSQTGPEFEWAKMECWKKSHLFLYSSARLFLSVHHHSGFEICSMPQLNTFVSFSIEITAHYSETSSFQHKDEESTTTIRRMFYNFCLISITDKKTHTQQYYYILNMYEYICVQNITDSLGLEYLMPFCK